jgi:ribonuclease BN (tRNA processing enzyme)
MKVVLLGTGGYHPSDSRQTACILLPELGVMFDAGTSVYRLRDYMPIDQLDIFITHAHLDHVVGLTYLLDSVPRELLNSVDVYGEQEKLDAIRDVLFAELLFPVPAPFRFRPLNGPVQLPSGARISHFPLHHPGGAVGYRLDLPDRSMAYVSDTIASLDADYLEAIRGVDLLLHEAYFVTEDLEMMHRTGHSHVQAAAEVAAAAEVGRLVLVHLSPLLKDESEIDLVSARRAFASTDIGADRMELEF